MDEQVTPNTTDEQVDRVEPVTTNDPVITDSPKEESATDTPVVNDASSSDISDDSKGLVISEITPEQIVTLKEEAIDCAKDYARKGTSSRKEPSPDLANNQGPYLWWENQDTYEANTWSISFWEYDSGYWQLQATKVELKPDGHSIMTAYSMRKDSDVNFPGFQVYKEQSDDRYHPALVEDIVYLNRVLKDLRDSGH